MVAQKKENEDSRFSDLLRIEGQTPIRTNWKIVHALQEDVSSSEFSRLWETASDLGINKKEYSGFLHINVRTLDRNLKEKFTLDIDKSEKALRIFRMMHHGINTFGNKEKFSKWLREDNQALGMKPIDLFGTIAGIEIVNNILTRIEYGIFS